MLNRGGNWNNTSNAGVFYSNLNNGRTNTNDNIGFRCSALLLRRVMVRANPYGDRKGRSIKGACFRPEGD